MKAFRIMIAAVGLAGLGACASDYSGSGYASSGGYVDPYEERHRAWWAAHNQELAYERREALREHRVSGDGQRNGSGAREPPLISHYDDRVSRV